MPTKSAATRDDREAQLATTLLPAGCPLGATWLDAAVAACKAHGARLDDVLRGGRERRMAKARAHAWAALLDLGYSYPEIARGWLVDQSTVNDAVRVHEPVAWQRRSDAYRSRPGFVRPGLASTARAVAAGQERVA